MANETPRTQAGPLLAGVRTCPLCRSQVTVEFNICNKCRTYLPVLLRTEVPGELREIPSVAFGLEHIAESAGSLLAAASSGPN